MAEKGWGIPEKAYNGIDDIDLKKAKFVYHSDVTREMVEKGFFVKV